MAPLSDDSASSSGEGYRARGASVEIKSVTGSQDSVVQLESHLSDSSSHAESVVRVPRIPSSVSWPITHPRKVGSWLFCGRVHAVAPIIVPDQPGGGGGRSGPGRPWAARGQRPSGSFDGVQPSSFETAWCESAASLSLQDLRSWRSEGPPEGRGAFGTAELWRLASQLLLDAEARLGIGRARTTQGAEQWSFLCMVCYERQALARRFRIAECRVDAHSCCAECAATFFRSRIQHGRVFELVCPVGAAEGGCALPEGDQQVALASREEVERCLANDAVALAKYDRFVKTKEDPALRECPDCRRLCSPKLNDAGRPQAEMHCEDCGADFCYYHAAAHRGGSCEEYEVRLAAETKGISVRFGTKNCPNCTRQTIKSGGCNHMTCQACRCNWCWACGERLQIRGPHGEDPTYWHYSDDNVESGCRQFALADGDQDPEAVRLWRRERRPGPCIRRLCEPVRSLAVAILMLSGLLTVTIWLLVYGICSLVLSVLRFAVRGGYKVRGKDRPDAWQSSTTSQILQPTMYFTAIVGMIVFLVPFTMLSLAWSVIALVFWGCLYMLSNLPLVRRLAPTTSRHHLRFILSAPLQAVHQFGSSSLARLADVRVQDDAQP